MVQIRLVNNYPALIIEGQEKNLVITDLHIGFEDNLSQNNIFLGKNTTVNESIKEVEKILVKTKPDSLILLGDIKSGIKSITKTEWNDVPIFLEKIKKRINMTIIPGNHDANIEKLIPEGISLATTKGMIIEDTLLTHGHTMPSENFSSVSKIIMGHVHPVFFQEKSIINGERVWVTIKCNKQKIFPSKTVNLEIIIIPTFNKHFYTAHKKFYKKSISPILDRREVLEAKILTLDSRIIGNESLLPNII